jgi:cytochrome c oxidase assembly protein subunit 15
MPFDPSPADAAPFVDPAQRVRIAVWLFALSGMIWVMVVLGGATRLTGSGLSIMEWAPISGVLPPLSHAEWQRLFRLYQAIPQFSLLHPDMHLAGFQGIFWLEWVHRLWGRLIGVFLLVPLVVFAWRGAIGWRLGLRLMLLFVLGGLQGAIGWFMVASGFRADSIAVSADRLVAHLLLALALYAGLLWTALTVLRPARPRKPWRMLDRLLAALAASLALTIAAGGLVAGLHAGLVYNSFPLMDGRLVPAGYAALSPWVRNLFENVAAVQFDHRLLATTTALLAVTTAAWGLAGAASARPLRIGLAVLAGAVALQYALGVATLLDAVPVELAVLHQATAVLVLTAVLCCLHLARRPGPNFWEFS